jgi:TolB-like protein
MAPKSLASKHMNNAIAAENEVLTSEQVLLALERVLISRTFIQSKRLSRFLRFVVEHSLQGKGGDLKEYTIATQVYDRESDFDPAIDTIVRSEARRLRKKLKEYYEAEGRRDEVVIAFLPGSYVPLHQVRHASPEPGNSPRDAVFIAVEAFECDAANPLAWECAFGISDELLHRLTAFEGIHVICSRALRSSRDGYVPEEEILNGPARVVLRGTVRAYDNLLRVTARATTADRRLLWSHRVDSLVEDATLIHLQERVATELLTQIGHWLSDLQRRESNPGTLHFRLLEGEETVGVRP